MAIDEQLIIAGSFNNPGAATKLNDENIIILGDLDSKNQVPIKKQKRLAAYALAEIDCIITIFG